MGNPSLTYSSPTHYPGFPGNEPVTIYEADTQAVPQISSPPPRISPSPNHTKRILLGFLRGIGSGLFILAFTSLLLTFGPILIQEINYRTRQKPVPQPQSGFGNLLEKVAAHRRQQAATDAAQYGVPTDFSIVIPKISAASPIIPNVNPTDEISYQFALKQGVAHAAGTQFPGQAGTIYLFAHSTNSAFNVARYNAVFYLLKELESGDDVIIFFAGQEFKYKVSERIITEANDTSWLTDTAGKDRLVLQTCWPPGTTFKRLIVIARPI